MYVFSMRFGVAFIALEIKRRLKKNITHKEIKALRAGMGREVQNIVVLIHNKKRKTTIIGKLTYKDMFFIPPWDLTARIAIRGIRKERSLREYMLATEKRRAIKNIPSFSNDTTRLNVMNYPIYQNFFLV
jgi:hypothetical protein